MASAWDPQHPQEAAIYSVYPENRPVFLTGTLNQVNGSLRSSYTSFPKVNDVMKERRASNSCLPLKKCLGIL